MDITHVASNKINQIEQVPRKMIMHVAFYFHRWSRIVSALSTGAAMLALSKPSSFSSVASQKLDDAVAIIVIWEHKL